MKKDKTKEMCVEKYVVFQTRPAFKAFGDDLYLEKSSLDSGKPNEYNSKTEALKDIREFGNKGVEYIILKTYKIEKLEK